MHDLLFFEAETGSEFIIQETSFVPAETSSPETPAQIETVVVVPDNSETTAALFNVGVVECGLLAVIIGLLVASLMWRRFN